MGHVWFVAGRSTVLTHNRAPWPLAEALSCVPKTTTTTIYQDVAEQAAVSSASNTNGTVSFEADENALAGIGFQLHHTKADM